MDYQRWLWLLTAFGLIGLGVAIAMVAKMPSSWPHHPGDNGRPGQGGVDRYRPNRNSGTYSVLNKSRWFWNPLGHRFSPVPLREARLHPCGRASR